MFLSTLVFAEGTRTWEQSKFEDLIKGTPRGVALRSNGGLELAPLFRPLTTTASTYIWSIASDSAGNIYVAAGSPARVYRVTPDGQSTPIFEPQELQVQALVVDKANTVYAATAPDGKVYRIQQTKPPAPANAAAGAEPPAPSWSATPYFDPGTKYIWDLVFDHSGNLYVATGDHGEIYKVTSTGQHSLFFKTDEVHIRALAVDAKGNVIAGSDGSGLVYRITPAGEGFVLYSAPKKEITALAVDNSGNIYAAGAGEKRPGPSTPNQPILLAPMAPTPGAPTTGQAGATPTATPSVMLSPFPAPGTGATGGSEIYRIAPDGSPTRMWSSRDDLVYALGFDQNGRLIAGTGNRVSFAYSYTLVSYAAIGAFAIAAGMSEPGGAFLVLISAAAASLGGASALVWGPQLLRDRRLGEPPGEPLQIRRDRRWIAAAVLVGIVYMAVLGPGLFLAHK